MATSTTTHPFIPIRLAQTIGITLSTFLGGANLSISFYLIPRILESPAPLLLRQWQNMYDIGKLTIPPMSIIAASAYFYLAYVLPSPHHGGHAPSFWPYVVAGALSASMVPYTGLFMLGTNGKLMAKAGAVTTVVRGDGEEEVVTELGDETAHKLVDWWGVLNLGRGGMLLASGILGLWTALGERR